METKEPFKTLLNMNKYWGIKMKVALTELDEVITFKGYLIKIDYQEMYGDTPLAYILLTYTNKGSISSVLGTVEDTYEWIFPIYDIKYGIEAVRTSLIDNSGGYLEDIEFIEYDDRSEMMSWAVLEKKDFDE